jgi:hypothetical protein
LQSISSKKNHLYNQNFLSYEEEVLLRAVIFGLNEDEINKLGGINRFWDLIKQYKLFGYIYFALKKSSSNPFPPEIFKELNNIYLTIVRLTLMHKKNTLAILRCFNEADIPAIVLKSPFLGERIYGGQQIRLPGADVDILIKRQDYIKTETMLQKLGYTVKWPSSLLNKGIFGAWHCLSPGKLNIDLHVQAIGKVYADFQDSDYWERLIQSSEEGVKVSIFSNEVNFIYLCLLVCREESVKFKRLHYLIDFYYFLENCKKDIDYEYLAKLINKNNFNIYALICLDLVREVFGQLSELNKDFLSNICIGNLRKNLVRHALLNLWENPAKTRPIQHFFLYMLAYSNGTVGGFIRKGYLHLRFSYQLYLDEHKLSGSISNLFRYFLFQLIEIW